MNYSTESKIWRVGGPLFAYLAISYSVKLCYYIGISCAQFNSWDFNAAFNGIMYTEKLMETENSYALIISAVSMLINIPILLLFLKRDYEYPANRRYKERSFVWKKYFKGKDWAVWPALIITGILASAGVSRLILMLPIDGILGDYSQIEAVNNMSSVWMRLFSLGLLSPVMEELLFRGLIYKRLKVYYDPTIAAYIAAIIFGVAHFNLVQGLYAFAMGIIFAFIHERFRTVLAPMIVHIAANLTAIIMGINPLSEMIDRYWFIKLPVAMVLTGSFAGMVIYLYKRKDIGEVSEENQVQESYIDERI